MVSLYDYTGGPDKEGREDQRLMIMLNLKINK